jgi:transcriptional regulator with XRE-family HTH domain
VIFNEFTFINDGGTMKVEEAFGLTLKNLRKSKGISQKKLAIESELERTYISMLERGIKSPTINTVFKLASSLEIKPFLLIEQTEELMFKIKKNNDSE